MFLVYNNQDCLHVYTELTHCLCVCVCTSVRDRFLSASEREQLGRLCKQLIDHGRCHFLQMKGFSSKLTRYISSDITLENVLLTAVPLTPHSS